MSELQYIAVDRIEPHPDNPRKDLGDLAELADSIKAKGILQNLTVVPWFSEITRKPADDGKMDGWYRCIIGHRRLAAAKLAGLKEVPCMVEDMSPKEQVQTMLLENMQRSDLTVYEQAQGFQMMLDLGSTVEEISEKSGFSANTVRRRVKMMELDQAKLKEVSARQISIGDFDALAKIEDIKDRNKVLESIGTRDFDANVSRALCVQKERKNRPLVKAWLKEVGAKEISQQDTWNGKYDAYPGCSSYIYLSKWGEEGNTPPKEIKGAVFYRLESSSLRLFKKREKAKPEKKSPEEIARTKAINAAWDKLDEASTVAYDLRKQFVEKMTMSVKARNDIMMGAMAAALYEAICYNSPDRTTIDKIFGIKTDSYDSKRDEKLAAGLAHLDDKDVPSLVYALFGDGAKEKCVDSSYRNDFPTYKLSIKLNLIYDWLVRLGYEMSTEEMQLLNGEYEAYHAKEAYDAKADTPCNAGQMCHKESGEKK